MSQPSRPAPIAWQRLDAVLRRLDLGTAGAPPPPSIEAAAAAMAAELGWSDERRQAEVRAAGASLAHPSPAA